MNTALLPYTRPDTIEAASFAIIDAEAGPDRPLQGRAWEIARRLIHTSADFDIAAQLKLDDTAIDAGLRALRAGAPIFTDTEMARCGMTARHLGSFGIVPRCWLSLPGVADDALARGITRSAAAVERIAPQLGGSIVAIGNAPTALLALLELLKKGVPAPALVVAMPVGFVNAAESKLLFTDWCAAHAGPACIALMGRKGGSPLVAATINALARLAESRTGTDAKID